MLKHEALKTLNWATITTEWPASKRQDTLEAAIRWAIHEYRNGGPPMSTAEFAQKIVLSGMALSARQSASAVDVICRDLNKLAPFLGRYAQQGEPYKNRFGKMNTPWLWMPAECWSWWHGEGKAEYEHSLKPLASDTADNHDAFEPAKEDWED